MGVASASQNLCLRGRSIAFKDYAQLYPLQRCCWEHAAGSRFSNGTRLPGGHPTMSLHVPEVKDSDEPATLYRVMQATIAQGLEESYQVPKEIPHQLLVLLMQINQRKRRK